MAEQDNKTELSKEVLAPPQEIRDDLVSTAVKFLQNPKVTQSPLSQKRAFLQRKGLTEEEIEAAVKKAGVSDPVPQSQTEGVQYAAPTPGQMAVSLPPAIPPKTPEPEYSRWMKARDMLAVISVVTGLSYAAYRLYKELLRPILFGIPSTDERLGTLEKNVAESMEKISQTLAGIEQVLGKQQEKLQMISHDVNSKATNHGMGTSQKETSISELKSELVSLKGLLLNRRQFPSMPATTPALPAWQLTQEAGENSNNKGKDEEEEENMSGRKSPVISFSTSPSPQVTASGAATSTKLSESENQSASQNEMQNGLPIVTSGGSPDLERETGDAQVGNNKVEVKGDVNNVDSVKAVPDNTDELVGGVADKDDAESTESLD